MLELRASGFGGALQFLPLLLQVTETSLGLFLMSEIKGDCAVDLLQGQGREVLPDRLRSSAIPILVDDGGQRDTAPWHVISTIAYFDVFALHQDRLTHFSSCGVVDCSRSSSQSSPLPGNQAPIAPQKNPVARAYLSGQKGKHTRATGAIYSHRRKEEFLATPAGAAAIAALIAASIARHNRAALRAQRRIRNHRRERQLLLRIGFGSAQVGSLARLRHRILRAKDLRAQPAEYVI